MAISITELMQLTVATLTTIGIVYVLHPIASRLGLLDHPGERRKQHLQPVASIGGIAIFAGLLLGTVVHLTDNPPTPELGYGLLGAALLVLVGVLDDRYSLGYKPRLLAQMLAAVILILGAGAELRGLGNLLGFGPIGLGWLSVPVTVLAIVGLINAFNLIDGIDGLAGGLAVIAFASLLMLTPPGTQATPVMLPLALATLLPYLAFNLELPGFRQRKIFLGEAGSMLLGYLVVWTLIDASQTQHSITPVTALWLVAIPLMDTFAVMGRRLRKGRSPFTADHHLHHLLTRLSGSPRQALVIILA